jgi:hypothetical protein
MFGRYGAEFDLRPIRKRKRAIDALFLSPMNLRSPLPREGARHSLNRS